MIRFPKYLKTEDLYAVDLSVHLVHYHFENDKTGRKEYPTLNVLKTTLDIASEKELI